MTQLSMYDDDSKTPNQICGYSCVGIRRPYITHCCSVDRAVYSKKLIYRSKTKLKKL